ARTFAVGKIDKQAQKLLDVTKKALDAGIKQAKAGGHVLDIAAAVQKTAETEGFSIVRDFVGHGIGRSLHEDPPVPNYGAAGGGPKLRDGMVLAIEPMINE